MKRRTRPLDLGERRTLEQHGLELELEQLLDEGDYCSRWPDTPLARVLASRPGSDAASAMASAASLLPPAAAVSSSGSSSRGGAPSVKIPEVLSRKAASVVGADAAAGAPASSPLPSVKRSLRHIFLCEPTPRGHSAAAADGGSNRRPLPKSKAGLALAASAAAGSSAAAASTELEHAAAQRFCMPGEWAVQLSAHHAPWSRSVERPYEDLVVKLEGCVFREGGKIPGAPSGGGGGGVSLQAARARREKLVSQARVWLNDLSARNDADAGERSETDLVELWAARRIGSARVGHEFGVPLVPFFFRGVKAFVATEPCEEYFLPVDPPRDDDDVSSSDNDDEDVASASGSSDRSGPRRGTSVQVDSSDDDDDDDDDDASTSAQSTSSSPSSSSSEAGRNDRALGAAPKRGRGRPAQPQPKAKAAAAARGKKAKAKRQPPSANGSVPETVPTVFQYVPGSSSTLEPNSAKSSGSSLRPMHIRSHTPSAAAAAAAASGAASAQHQRSGPQLLRFRDIALPLLDKEERRGVHAVFSTGTALALLQDVHVDRVRSALDALALLQEQAGAAARPRNKKAPARQSAAARKDLDKKNRLEQQLHFVDVVDDGERRGADDDKLASALERHISQASEEALRESFLARSSWTVDGDAGRALLEEELFEL